jgi:hypothetical protein
MMRNEMLGDTLNFKRFSIFPRISFRTLDAHPVFAGIALGSGELFYFLHLPA